MSKNLRRFGTGSPAPVSRRSLSAILATAGLFVLIGYSTVRSVMLAASKPFWFDEVCTWIIVGLGSPHKIWQALMDAADGQPPLFYLIEGHLSSLVHSQEIGFRIASIIGFACVQIFMFVFVRRRIDAVYALLCTTLLLLTTLFDTYAVEARPYSMEVACFALALVCYQRAPAALWMVLMGLALALAENLHYYAVFSLVPFGAAEIALSLQTRRIRPAVWLALLCGCLPLLWLFPLVRALKASYSEHLMSSPSLVGVVASYGWMFAPRANVVMVVVLVMLGTAALFVAGAATVQTLFGSPNVRTAWASNALSSELVLALGFLLLPFVAYMGTKIAHGEFTERYILSMVLSIPLAACYIFPRMGRKGRIGFTAVAILLISAHETRFWISQDHRIGQFQSPAIRVEHLVRAAGYQNLPVVISSAGQYLELNHYAPLDMDRRLLVLVDSPRAITYNGTDTTDKEMLALRSYAPMHVEEFSLFKTARPEFLLLSNGEPRLDWWPASFRGERDAELRVVASQDQWTIYLVKLIR